MSMTQPMTTLTRGQCAPLLQRSSPAPRSTLPQRRQGEFLRDDLRRRRADYFANLSLTDPTPAMHALLLIFPVLAFAALAAHFYRAGSWPLMLMSLVLIVLLAWPRAWVARLVQVCLVAGALEWVWTAFGYIQQRMALGQPWSRLALILAAVALFTAAAALVFRHRRLRARFALG
jgi:hypothetical protein